MDKLTKEEFKETWDICPTGTGVFWKKHRNRYLPETLEKWFDEHLNQLLKAEKENLVKYLTVELKRTIESQIGLNKESSAKCYLQGIESAIISIDEEFDFGISEKILSEN